MFLVVRWNPSLEPGKRLVVTIDDLTHDEVLATQKDIEESGTKEIIIYAKEFDLDHEKAMHLSALHVLLVEGSEIAPGWLAIEEIVRQGLLAGVAIERTQKLPLPVQVS